MLEWKATAWQAQYGEIELFVSKKYIDSNEYDLFLRDKRKRAHEQVEVIGTDFATEEEAKQKALEICNGRG